MMAHPSSTHDRKVKILAITPETLVDLFKNELPSFLSFSGIPKDARYLSARFNLDTEMIEILLESESFPVIRAGMVVERFGATVTRHVGTQQQTEA